MKFLIRSALMTALGLSLVIGLHLVLDRAAYKTMVVTAPDATVTIPRTWQEVTVQGVDPSVYLHRFAPAGRDDIWVQLILVGPASATTVGEALGELEKSYSQLSVATKVNHVIVRDRELLETTVEVDPVIRELDRPVLGQRFHVLAVGHMPDSQSPRWRKAILKILGSVQAS